jgi:hypothetical protein
MGKQIYCQLKITLPLQGLSNMKLLSHMKKTATALTLGWKTLKNGSEK